MKVAHTAGTETGFSKNVDEMKGDHPAGVRMKAAHTAGTEMGLSKNQNTEIKQLNETDQFIYFVVVFYLFGVS